MNPEAEACVTPDDDHLLYLIEYLRKPDARLSVEGELWSMCWGTGDPLNLVLADRLSLALSRPTQTSEAK